MAEYVFHTKKDGKEVKVFLPEEEIDKESMQQIKSISENPILNHIRFMPDVHAGTGCCVGLTTFIDEGILPNLVGVDIGCGISCLPIDIVMKEKKLEKLDKMIKENIPMGKGKINIRNITEESDWEELFRKSNVHLNNLKLKYPEIDFEYNWDWFVSLIKRVGSNIDYDLRALGSLGSGNHYIEINKDDTNKSYVTVHTGSRNLGKCVCAYHHKLTQEQIKVNQKDFHRLCDKIPKKIKGKERELKEDEIWAELQSKLSVPWLEKDRMKNYLVDMIFTQNYASLNRKCIIREVCSLMGISLDLAELDSDMIETVHNYIDFERMILRKGAISAQKGEISIISLNMKEGILLVEGKGNEDWNYSSAHGCGRILNRSKAAKLNMKTFEKEMEGIVSSSISKETLDESPMAYKDVELIKHCLEGNVTILHQLKPILNCKGI